jgi:hypothetical protein
MDGDNVSDSNQEDEIHRLIQDTFSTMDEDNKDIVMMLILYSRSHVNFFMKAQQQIFYLLYCCW